MPPRSKGRGGITLRDGGNVLTLTSARGRSNLSPARPPQALHKEGLSTHVHNEEAFCARAPRSPARVRLGRAASGTLDRRTLAAARAAAAARGSTVQRRGREDRVRANAGGRDRARQAGPFRRRLEGRTVRSLG